MGQYTELIIKAMVRRDIPNDVGYVLDFLFHSGERPETLPDHRFFRLERWTMIGRCSSSYHIPWTSSRYDNDYLFSRSDMKNYGGEIEAFLDWVDPYLDEDEGDCIGWMCHEHSTPILVMKGARGAHCATAPESTPLNADQKEPL
jgi:hypothetical protein